MKQFYSFLIFYSLYLMTLETRKHILFHIIKCYIVGNQFYVILDLVIWLWIISIFLTLIYSWTHFYPCNIMSLWSIFQILTKWNNANRTFDKNIPKSSFYFLSKIWRKIIVHFNKKIKNSERILHMNSFDEIQ